MAVHPARKRRSPIQTPLFLKEVPTQTPALDQPAAIPLAEAGTFLEDLEAAELAWMSAFIKLNGFNRPAGTGLFSS
jgi:hypothetical protein